MSDNTPAPLFDPKEACLRETGHKEAFTALTQLAQSIFGADYASVAILQTEQFATLSHQPLPVSHFPLPKTFSGQVVSDRAPLVVLDAAKDARFADNPFVTGKMQPRIGFYVGAPVWLEGEVIGSFSLIDAKARDAFSPEQMVMLNALADQAGRLLALSLEARTRQASLARLELQRRQIDLMQEMTGTGYYRFDFRTRKLEVSKGVYSIFRLPEDAPAPDVEACMAMIVEPDRVQLADEIERARLTDEPFTLSMRIIAPGDHSMRDVISRGHIERDAQGEPVGLFAVVQDVTESLSRERELSDSRRRLDMIETATGIGFWYQKFGDPHLQWSRGIYALLGYDPLTYQPKVGSVSGLVHDEAERERVGNEVARAIAERKSYDFSFAINRASDQSLRYIRTVGHPQTGPDGEVVAMFGLAHDVTDIQLAAEGLRQAKQAAEALSQAKSDFIANISHDLRTPLTTITGYADLLLKDISLSAEARWHTAQIHNASRTLSSLVNDVLDAAKLDKRQMDLNPVCFDFRALMDDLAGQARMALSDKPVSLDVRFEAPFDRVETLWIEADELRLRQVMQNLIGNACKFTLKGEIRIAIGLMPEAGQHVLSVSVADTGPGIEDKIRPQIFDRFVHAHSSLNRMAGGSGLGLSIAREIMRLMGGDIGFDSEVGTGSRFHFKVPIALCQPLNQEPPVEEVPQNEVRMRVLIVDDHVANRELLRRRLLAFGMSVDEALNGAEAVTKAEAQAYDVIFMDIQMPVMDGLTATRTIKGGDGPNRATPVIALSAMSEGRLKDYDERENEAGYGFAGVLTKPVETLILRQVLLDLTGQAASN